ncbi:MAG: 2-hydroxyacyl-CoA dehydratase family protein [Deltaproteobacteria bacterium]|nr:2-hydroxyacyl-CoA dehydratase family protein [Deltaproteobacteria bacterium]
MKHPEIPGRQAAIDAHRAAGGGLAAVYPIHPPRALLRAFGLLPVEIWGPPGVDCARADGHVQAYACSIVRGGLAFLLDGKLDDADLILVPHGCDSLQGLGSVLIDFVKPKAPVETFYLPRGAEGGPSRAFVKEELRRLHDSLVKLTGKQPTEAELLEALEREVDADDLLAALLAGRRRLELSNAEFYRLVRAREYLPAEDFSRIVREVLEGASEEESGAPGVVLSGLVPEPRALLELFDEAGVLIVGDDLCSSGRRLYPAGEGSDALARMADRLMSAAPDSTRGDGVQARADHLLGLCAAGGAKQTLFLIVKFCEPELFYLPQLREALTAGGVASQVLEVDVTTPLADQTRTRIEAMLEVMS